MENTEDLDLDSLMDLLENNEDFSAELSAPAVVKNSVTDESSATEVSIPSKTRSLELRNMFQENLLCPERIINPKEEEKRPDLSELSIKDSVVHLGDPFDSDNESESHLTETGIDIQRVLKKKQSFTSAPEQQYKFLNKNASTSWKMKPNQSISSKNSDNVTVDRHSGIRIINPLISFALLNQRMEGRRMIKMSSIQNFVKHGDIEGDWVTIGVLTVKTPPRTSQNGNTYSLWKMSDLNDTEKPIVLFLFKGAHKEHWKITIGTVIGILNPSFLNNQDSNKSGDIRLSVDKPGKLLLIGTSKDLGFCKSVKKNGLPCNAPVNKYLCEYCIYHVKNEYKKFSSKRSEIQAAYSGREPNLKDRLLKGQNVFYGGQSFTTAPVVKKQGQLKAKDKLTLSNLQLKRKADVLESEEREKSVKKLADMYGPNILRNVEKNSEYLNNQLTLPSAGTRNLIQHMMKDKIKQEEQTMKVITPKELLKMRESQMATLKRNIPQKNDASTLRNLTPQIGKGLSPGQKFDLSSPLPKSNQTYSFQDYAKMKAINKIKENGPLKRKNPNSVKSSPEAATKVQAVLNKSFEEKKDPAESKPAEPAIPHSKLGTLDLNSEKVKEILNRKSSHLYEVETVEMEKEAAYFNNLEKKEKMEEKMSSTMEIVSDVVSCLKCKYTAHSSSERCRKEQHPLKCHKALKRFFRCKSCNYRTFCFTRVPSRHCRKCNNFDYERVSMLLQRKGPKLDSETLLLRGEELKFL